MNFKKFDEKKNQCDGCRRGLPLRGNIHYHPESGISIMTCQARLYGFAPGDSTVILGYPERGITHEVIRHRLERKS